MTIYQEISAAWPELRAVAGVDIVVGGVHVEALLVSDIRVWQAQFEESNTSERRTRLAIRDFDWRARALGEDSIVNFRGKQWRIAPFDENPLSPIIFADVVCEGETEED